LICYFGVPLIAGWLLGAHNALSGSFTFSNVLGACLGIGVLYQLLGLKGFFLRELTARLDKPGQPHGAAAEFSGTIVSAAGYIITAALLLPPLGEMFPGSRLMTLVKVFALGYTVYMAYVIWKLSGPFLAYHPAPDPPAVPHEPHAAALGRCAKCGQLIDASMKVCAFCKHPMP